MGFYINPMETSKKKWLDLYADPIPLSEAVNFDFTQNPDHLPLVLVDNGMFRALGIMYNEDQRDHMTIQDGRPMSYYVTHKDNLNVDTGLPLEGMPWHK